MRAKVTVQDIADALGLSRTTVSKVLNGSPAVSDATREAVMDKVRELNYRALPSAEAAAAPVQESVDCFALVMHAIPGGIHMGTIVIPSMDQKLRQAGLSLMTCAISDAEYDSLHLPPILSSPQIKAIVCLELFHPEYSRLLCSLGKPVLFIDACADFPQANIDADLLMMDNRSSIAAMLRSLIRRHSLTAMGFVGDPDHCYSFRERYESFLLTAVQAGISDTSRFSIIEDDRYYGDVDWMYEQLVKLPELPQLFCCANDFLAQTLIRALGILGKQVPQDVMVCGFDGLPSLSRSLNRMTTVVTPSDQLGAWAVGILLRRLSLGENVCSATYLRTRVLFRETAP